MIEKAANILKNGGLVAMPTETVYGLAADARNPVAVRRIFTAKQRPFHHPLIVHIGNFAEVNEWAREIPEAVKTLATHFWPGPLTLILKKQSNVLDMITAGQETIALRIPSHPIAQALLEAFGSGLAAPSANQFTHISPTQAQAVYEELADKVDLVLDGGDCTVGVESTILDLTQVNPVIRRPGIITAQMLSAILNMKIEHAENSSANMMSTFTPGMHTIHYAPITKTILLDASEIKSGLQTVTEKTGLITHSEMTFSDFENVHHVALSSDPFEYARDIYRVLRELDHLHLQKIIIEKSAVR